jgi:hypothetical protein
MIEIRTDYIIGILMLGILLGGIYGFLWLRKHPNAD